MRKKIKKAFMIFLLILGTYLGLGHLLHRVIFPEKRPDISQWFEPGQEFYSKAEGFRQRVISQANGHVHCALEIDPHADGPPPHIHTDFDETFEIENGELSVWVDGEVKKIRPGQVLHVPKGTPHKPYNETNDTIRLKGSIAFPEAFAFHLFQLYSLTNEQPNFQNSSTAILQMPLFQSNGLDSYLGDGPPVMMQKITGFVVTPLSRLLGYRSYYEKYDVKHANYINH